MNVYDFDGTIYDGDSTVDFYLFALKQKPSLLRFLPKQAAGFALYALKKIGKTELKEYFYSFLQGMDAAGLLEGFWDKHWHKIFPWYLDQKEPEDIVISASPEFLLGPACRRLEVGQLIASRVDPKTGKYTGENCRGEEKVRRLREEAGDVQIKVFYSDSHSDQPLAVLAERAYLIKKGNVCSWDEI